MTMTTDHNHTDPTDAGFGPSPNVDTNQVLADSAAAGPKAIKTLPKQLVEMLVATGYSVTPAPSIYTAPVGEDGEYEIHRDRQYVGTIKFYSDAYIALWALRRSTGVDNPSGAPAMSAREIYTITTNPDGKYTIWRGETAVGEFLYELDARRFGVGLSIPEPAAAASQAITSPLERLRSTNPGFASHLDRASLAMASWPSWKTGLWKADPESNAVGARVPAEIIALVKAYGDTRAGAGVGAGVTLADVIIALRQQDRAGDESQSSAANVPTLPSAILNHESEALKHEAYKYGKDCFRAGQSWLLAQMPVQDPGVSELSDEQAFADLRREGDDACRILRESGWPMGANRLNSAIIELEQRVPRYLAQRQAQIAGPFSHDRFRELTLAALSASYNCGMISGHADRPVDLQEKSEDAELALLGYIQPFAAVASAATQQGITPEEAWNLYIRKRTHLLDTSHNRTIFMAGFGASRAYAANQPPALSKDADGNYKTGDDDLDLLLGLTEDMALGRARMDTAMWWHDTLRKVTDRLQASAPTLAWLIDPGQGSARDRVTLSEPDAATKSDIVSRNGSITELISRGARSTPQTRATASRVDMEPYDHREDCTLCGEAFGRFGCTCQLHRTDDAAEVSSPPGLGDAVSVGATDQPSADMEQK
jgi:hypothetical protein